MRRALNNIELKRGWIRDSWRCIEG